MTGIGVMREGPLHSALKRVIARPGDRLEVPVGGFVIDVVRADGELVEIQTGGFSALARKLDVLLDTHRVRIVLPVAARRRIVRVGSGGEILSSRRSPRRASALEVFDRLVAFPSLLSHPHLVVEVLLLDEDHVRGPEPVRVRRRTRDPGQRRLVEVLERVEIREVEDLLAVLPRLPAAAFSTRELAALAGCGTVLAGRIVYCLRALGVLEPAGRRGAVPLYACVARAAVASA